MGCRITRWTSPRSARCGSRTSPTIPASPSATTTSCFTNQRPPPPDPLEAMPYLGRSAASILRRGGKGLGATSSVVLGLEDFYVVEPLFLDESISSSYIISLFFFYYYYIYVYCINGTKFVDYSVYEPILSLEFKIYSLGLMKSIAIARF
ncbi:hypothetical protein KSP40_PGU010739 [Platanthera guangdongensis]|uniref:Uncharacterized protein n=1 Tax=Platanthera guangdongensis TaxID=2320717 RepID=A0ABR2N607_9ASPA